MEECRGLPHKQYFLLAVVTMETPIPGLAAVSGDVTAHVDDIIRGDRRVDEE